MSEQETNKTDEASHERSLINIQISDILGVSKATKSVEKITNNILTAIEKGIGKLSEPLMTLIQAKTKAVSLSIESKARIEQAEKLIELITGLPQITGLESMDEQVSHTVNRVIARVFSDETEKQVVREQVTALFIEELKNYPLPEDNDAQEISKDWLNLFWSFVENKTDEDLQKIFAKILAGECVKPGSFSARLLHILSIMNKQDALAFQAVCSLAIHDESGVYLIEPVEEYENFLHDTLTDTLKYDQFIIEDLESLGLLGRNSHIDLLRRRSWTRKTNCRYKS